MHPALLKRLCALSESMAGVEIRTVGSGHVLSGTPYNLGLYAAQSFRRGVTLGQYAGMIENSGRLRCWRKNEEGVFNIDLDTADSLSSAQGLMLDAKHVGNEGRIINDFRGIAPEENVRFKTCANSSKGIWVDIVATRAISRGDEILADYDYLVRDEEGKDTVGRSAPQPPEASPQQFELGSIRVGEDGCTFWTVKGSHEGFKEGRTSKQRKQGRFQKRWVLEELEDEEEEVEVDEWDEEEQL